MIELHQMQVVPGDPERNLKRILLGIDQTTGNGAALAVFPEMALPGYLLGDEWENDALLRELAEMNAEIIAYTRGRAAAVWGSVLADFNARGEDGRTRKYNAAFVAADGHPVSNGVFDGYTIKSLMPKYREFDDERHFFSLLKLAQERGVEPRTLLAPFPLIQGEKTRKVGVLLCEDMWDDDYAFQPTSTLRAQGAEMFLNLSSSPYGIGKQAKRDRILVQKSEGCEFYYVNCVGAQDNGKNVFIFDGASPIYRDGRKLAQGADFLDCVVVPEDRAAADTDETAKIHGALLEGLRATLARMGAGKVVIGLSGGVDSAVVAALCVEVLGAANVIGVNMPSRYNTTTTKGLAQELAQNLGIRFLIAPIEEAVDLTRRQVAQLTGRPVTGLVDENIQARDRSSRVLAAIAAQETAVFTNNGNKTELAQGYCTLYGDVSGAVAPLADLYKTQVYALAAHINGVAASRGPLIPVGILKVKPTAELSESQNPDNGGGDPFVFDYHDKLLYQMIELRRDPEQLLEDLIAGNVEVKWGLKRNAIGVGGYFANAADMIADIETAWRRLKGSFFKRVQAPPILTVSKRAFGFDLREFQAPAHFTRGFQTLKAQALTSIGLKSRGC